MKIEKITRAMRKILPPRYCGAVIVAAGTASRMGGIDKIMAELHGEPMIVRTVRAFQNCDSIREIVIVTREDLIMKVNGLCAGFKKVQAVVQGGKSRQASVQMGLNALSKRVRVVAIHDGARPLVSNEVIERAVRAGDYYGAAAPAIPVKDTVKIVDRGIVTETPDRARLNAIQTPQVFDFDLIRGALKDAEEKGAELTDDCSAAERMGMTVKTVEGDEKNIKITTHMDLKIAELLLEETE